MHCRLYNGPEHCLETPGSSQWKWFTWVIQSKSNTDSFQYARQDESFQTNVIYLNYKVAFDSFDYNVLLKKMPKLGLTNKILFWLKSCVVDSTYAVTLDQCISQRFGVPHGSNLAPYDYKIDGSAIKHTDHIKNVGVILDIKLTFGDSWLVTWQRKSRIQFVLRRLTAVLFVL